MKLSFFGADREVTGSCHGAEVNGKHILIDCGMHQGGDNEDVQDFPFHPSDIDAVIVTHAHIDHSGRLPLLIKQGYRNKIYATGATIRLLEIMLRDSAHIQEMDADWKNRKGKRAGDREAEPLYTVRDADEVFEHVVPCNYNTLVEIADDIKIRFTDAGHLLGSAFVEMWLTESGVTKKVVFSGDIGNIGQPIIRDPQYGKEADIAVMEATYGDRNHEVPADYTEDLAKIINQTLREGGNVIFPSFAVGRTQELLYFIREMKERGLVTSAPDFPVYVDSPLASAATRIYEGELEGYLDEDTIKVIRSGKKFLQFENLHIVETSEESKAINFDDTPKVIISSSGMCEAGRIRHHLKHNLWRPECAVVFVGFQAQGTLGRILLEGQATRVTIFGEEIAVKCKRYSFRGMSAHADRDGLLKWIGAFAPHPEKVFIVHGEANVCDLFADTLRSMQYDAVVPRYTAEYNVLTGEMVYEGQEPEVRKPVVEAKRESPVYQRLVAAGKRLLDVIKRSSGRSNKELAAFVSQVDSLLRKWDR